MGKWGFLLMGHLKKGGTTMAKKLTTLYLDVELLERLNKLSALTRVPKAVYTREAVDLALDKHEKEIKMQREKKEV
jgi:predicted DNA-binding protein